MRRRAVQVVVELLDVLAVVTLQAGEPKQPVLQDRIAPIPKRQCEAQPLMPVADPGDSVLVPPVGPGSRVIVRKVVPRRPESAVILANRSPGAFTKVRTPTLPVTASVARLLESDFLTCLHQTLFLHLRLLG